LQRVLSVLTAWQPDALVVVKLDRLTRNLRDFADSYFGEGRPSDLLPFVRGNVDELKSMKPAISPQLMSLCVQTHPFGGLLL
jgi:hypothetical protein